MVGTKILLLSLRPCSGRCLVVCPCVAPRCIKGSADMCAHTLCSSSPHRMSLSHFLLLLSWHFLQAVSAHPLASPPPAPRHKRDDSRNVPSLCFYDPHGNGGSWLTVRLRLLPNMRRQTDFLTYHTLIAHPNIPGIFFGVLASQQHLPCWPWRTDQRRYPWDIRPRGSG